MFKTILWLIGLVGTSLIWIANAELNIQHYDSNISYTLNGWFNAEKIFTWVWIITISDWTTKITILDRNLWAMSMGTWCKDSSWEGICLGWDDTYGYHFQWWNNYWFPSSWIILTSSTMVNSLWYWPGKYYSWDAFIIGSTGWDISDNWNLRWWVEDDNDFDVNDESWKVNNASERQWPCPAWFHVPSVWEWEKLSSMFENWLDMHKELLIPFAGFRNHNSEVSDMGFDANYWSSSPSFSGYSPTFYIYSDGDMGTFHSGRVWANSVRCFYNGYTGYVTEITNIDISWIVEPLIWQPPVVWPITVNSTPNNAITLWAPGYETSTIIWWHAPGFAQTNFNYRVWLEGHEIFSDTTWHYYLRVMFMENSWYKVSDSVVITANWKTLVKDIDYIGQYNTFLNTTSYAIKIYYPASELPIWIERVILSWNILPLVHWAIPTKNITTDTTWIELWDITRWKWDECTPLAENETIDASNSNYCLSIKFATQSWYATTFDYEIFLNGGHRVGYYDGDGTYACTSSLIKNQKITPSYKVEFISFWEVIDTRYREHWCTLAVCTNYGDGLRKPYKQWYNFEWWFADENFNTPWDRNNDTITKNTKIYAKWTENPSWEWENWDTPNQTILGYSWWGKRTIADILDNKGGHGVADDNTEKDHSTEFEQAYKFAYKNWITTMNTIQEADMEWWLTRIAMAKMLSQYAINVLWQKPANIIVPNFRDMPKELDDEYDYGVSLAYQLWIMWINIPDNKFRPLDLVTRAEFATALSRMLYKLADWDPYYVTHMAKLKDEWIITNDNPEMLEIRWYVMIMLMRSVKHIAWMLNEIN